LVVNNPPTPNLITYWVVLEQQKRFFPDKAVMLADRVLGELVKVWLPCRIAIPIRFGTISCGCKHI